MAIDVLEETIGGLTPASERHEAPRDMLERVEGLLATSSLATRLADLAFVSRLGLSQRRVALLASSTSPDPWYAISECSSAIREISKALSALEIASAELFGVPPRSRYYITELERSILVRHAYAQLRRDVHALGEPTCDNVEAVLRRATTALAKLAGRDAYGSLRVHDRQQLCAIRERIATWVRSLSPSSESTSDARRSEGLRIYRDTSNLTELMMGINRRAELIVHDLEVLRSARRALRELAPSAMVRIAVDFPALRDVEGRCPQLDALIFPERSVRVESLASAVQLACESLGRVVPTPIDGAARPPDNMAR